MRDIKRWHQVMGLSLVVACASLVGCGQDAPVAPAPSDIPPTSVNVYGISCAVITIREGVTVVPEAVWAIGSVCRPGPWAEVSGMDCADGSELVTASGYAWWFPGEPAHVAEWVPPEVIKACMRDTKGTTPVAA